MGKRPKEKKEFKVQLNEGHYIEALDRANILCDMVEDILLTHPVYLKHKKLRNKLEMAQDIIGEVYQQVGMKLHNKFDEEPDDKLYDDIDDIDDLEDIEDYS